MITVGTFADVRGAVVGRTGLVPTMGYLHEGHLALIGAAREASETVVVSIFVNPLQFGDADDLRAYPRDLDRDVGLARSAGADIVFAPSLAEMYPGHPEPPSTSVSVADVTDAMEGAFRPGHFTGVATVVAKLLAGIAPDTAYFGHKDAQQLAVIRTMVDDLSFPVRIEGVPVVREHDGLALSSRNVRLGPADRASALCLSRALMAAADLIERGVTDATRVLDTASGVLGEVQGVIVDYVELADARTAQPMTTVAGDQFLAVAARVGPVRLIDALPIVEGSPDRGRVLSSSSILYGGT